jgi:hypothetical protein
MQQIVSYAEIIEEDVIVHLERGELHRFSHARPLRCSPTH